MPISGDPISDQRKQKLLELAKKCISMDYPLADLEELEDRKAEGIPTRPTYEMLSDNRIVRHSDWEIDHRILEAAYDRRKLCTMAMADSSDQVYASHVWDVISHCASIPEVRAFFLLPYYARVKVVVEGSSVPPEDICRLYSGVENLLVEICEADGNDLTDETVKRKVHELMTSTQ